LSTDATVREGPAAVSSSTRCQGAGGDVCVSRRSVWAEPGVCPWWRTLGDRRLRAGRSARCIEELHPVGEHGKRRGLQYSGQESFSHGTGVWDVAPAGR
jgi:hypothetical protein